MRLDRRGVSPIALLLLVFLLIAILGVSTVLVGRALGWWTYADLPVIGRFFPQPAVEQPEGDPETGLAEEPEADSLAGLTEKLSKQQAEIALLQLTLAEKSAEAAELEARLAQLTADLERQAAQQSDEKWQEVAKMLQNMRAEQAAAIISHYEDKEISLVLQLMPAESAGGILSKLDPARAAKVTAAKR